MKWLKRILFALGVMLALALVLPIFISFNDYIPQIESELSAKLKEQVSIKNIKFTALPTPHVTFDGIKCGTTDDIRLAKVVVTPDILSLFQSSIVIKNIEVDSLILTQRAIGKLSELSKTGVTPPLQPPTRLRLEAIHFINAQLILGKMNFGPFEASVHLGGNSKLVEASIATLDGKLKAVVKPDQSNYLIDASAKKWIWPIGPHVLFDEVNIKGIATFEDIKLNKIDANLYGGTANGQINLRWHKGFKLNGNLDIKQVEMRQIASMLSSKTHVSGKLNAKPVFSASATSLEQMKQNLHLETSFKVQNGVLYGVDIQKVATNLIKKGSTGGETRFDQFSGHLDMMQGAYHLTQLKIVSGTLAVEGNVNISRKKDISGRINAQVKVAGISSNVPLNVAGTIDSPMLYPTGATIAGAAVGTAIMGPGVGTSVGAKVGDWVDNMFSRKKK